jgi:hypothetical protein
MKMRVAMTSAVLSLSLAAAASADVLWDQSAISLSAPLSYQNHVTSSVGFGGQREAYGLADITVGASGWTIDSMSVFMSFWAIDVNGPATTAVLNIFAQTPGQPPSSAFNPRRTANGGVGQIVNVTTTNFTLSGQSIDQVTASGLNLYLAPGNYWIGLTPIYSGGSFGQPNQWPSATTIGADQYFRGANLTTMDANWTNNAAAAGAGHGDGAFILTGTFTPAPGAAALLGVAGLAAGRRRRSN